MEAQLFSVAGITTVIVLLFTLLFQYAPVVRVKWAGLKREAKKAIVLGLYLITGAIVAFAGCIPALATTFPFLLCSTINAFVSYAVGVVIAIGLGQGVFSLMPELDEVKIAKDDRAWIDRA